MPFCLDWGSSESHLFLNPRLPQEQVCQLQRVMDYQEDYPGHIWLTTSGSSGEIKLVGLSKEAMLASAKAANSHIESNHTDVWYNALPHFHVGGLSIYARAHLSGAKVIESTEKWSAETFIDHVSYIEPSLVSLVPAQIYDLVMGGHQAPPSLRAVIVGGGALPHTHFVDACNLGWPLLQSYGLTECASQVATGTRLESSLKLLGHVDAKLDNTGCLMIKSPALLTCYAEPLKKNIKFTDPKVDGWLTTEDIAELLGDGHLKMLGRKGDFIKIGGESVSMPRLENVLETVKRRRQYIGDLALVAVPDQRLGHVIHLAAEENKSSDLRIVVRDFDAHVLPFEKIRQVHLLPYLPRSPLKKLLRAELLQIIAAR